MTMLLFKDGPADGHYCVDDTRHAARVLIPIPVSMIAALDDGMGDTPRRSLAYEHDGYDAVDGSRVMRYCSTS